MIDCYLERSPAAEKVPFLLEEAGLLWNLLHISVGQGHQHDTEFEALSPNHKVPVIVDHHPADGGLPITVFESGAILVYLADKLGRFIPEDIRGRTECIQWTFWQSAGLSPMSGQAIHFIRYAPAETQSYGQQRYCNEVNRLYGVLNRQLADREFICGDYTIADIGAYSWFRLAEELKQNLDEFPNVKRWHTAISARPAIIRARERMANEITHPTSVNDAEMRRNIFGHTAASLKLV